MQGAELRWKVLFVAAPASYMVDSRSDFQRVKKLCFDEALGNSSVLHVLVAAGANQYVSEKKSIPIQDIPGGNPKLNSLCQILTPYPYIVLRL
jgi:hypothetical protein